MIVLDYTTRLYDDILDFAIDYHQTGWTVCGAEDPAVVSLSEQFGEIHPELAEYPMVRIIDKYVGPNKSDTLLEFSDREMTDEEYQLYEELMEEEEQ